MTATASKRRTIRPLTPVVERLPSLGDGKAVIMLTSADLRVLIESQTTRPPRFDKNRPTGFLMMSKAAALAGCSRATLWKWIVEGIVPSHAVLRVGSRCRVRAEWCLTAAHG